MSKKVLIATLLGLSHLSYCSNESKKSHHPKKTATPKPSTEKSAHQKSESKATPVEKVTKKSESLSDDSGSTIDKGVRKLVLDLLAEGKIAETLAKHRGERLTFTSAALAELASNFMNHQLMMLAHSHKNLEIVIQKLVIEAQAKLGAALLCLFLETGVDCNLDLPATILPRMAGLNFQIKNMQYCLKEDKQKLCRALASGNLQEIREIQAEVCRSILATEEELQQFIDKLLCRTLDSCIQETLRDLRESSDKPAEDPAEDDWEALL